MASFKFAKKGKRMKKLLIAVNSCEKLQLRLYNAPRFVAKNNSL